MSQPSAKEIAEKIISKPHASIPWALFLAKSFLEQCEKIERLEKVVQRVKEVITKGEDHPDCPLIDLGEALDALDEDAT